jgi:hypothetical protein
MKKTGDQGEKQAVGKGKGKVKDGKQLFGQNERPATRDLIFS